MENTVNTLEQLSNITTEGHTLSSYNGKIGCTCGCLGTHRDTPRARTIALNKIKKATAETVAEMVFNDYADYSFEDGLRGALTIYYKNNDRQTILYLNEAGTKVAREAFAKAEQSTSSKNEKRYFLAK